MENNTDQKNKTILFLEAVQNFGGARKSTVELAARLMNDGENILIVDFWGSCLPFVEEVNRQNLPIEILEKRNTPIILSEGSMSSRVLNVAKHLYKTVQYRRKFAQLCAKHNPDYVIVNNLKTLSILRKNSGYKIFFFARGWFLPQTISSKGRLMFKKMVDCFIGVSQSTRQAIYAGGFAELKDIYVIPNAIEGVPDAKRNWSMLERREEFQIMHCGGFLPTKGQEVALRIAKELKNKNVRFKMKLVGVIYQGVSSQKYYDKILSLIKDWGLEKYVNIVLNKPNVIDLFPETDVLIHPSDTEGLPRVVMEAMAFGKPVIGNPVGGMLDYINHNFTGYITNHNSVYDYVEYLTELYENKDKYKFISNNCRNLIVNSYSSANQLENAKNVFR